MPLRHSVTPPPPCGRGAKRHISGKIVTFSSSAVPRRMGMCTHITGKNWNLQKVKTFLIFWYLFFNILLVSLSSQETRASFHPIFQTTGGIDFVSVPPVVSASADDFPVQRLAVSRYNPRHAALIPQSVARRVHVRVIRRVSVEYAAPRLFK